MSKSFLIKFDQEWLQCGEKNWKEANVNSSSHCCVSRNFNETEKEGSIEVSGAASVDLWFREWEYQSQVTLNIKDYSTEQRT